MDHTKRHHDNPIMRGVLERVNRCDKGTLALLKSTTVENSIQFEIEVRAAGIGRWSFDSPTKKKEARHPIRRLPPLENDPPARGGGRITLNPRQRLGRGIGRKFETPSID